MRTLYVELPVSIDDLVAAPAPFMMNTQGQIDQAHRDFEQTHFGAWPWPQTGPVHQAGEGRFVQYPGVQERVRPPA